MRTRCSLIMFFLLCSTCIFAQFRYQASDGYIRIGEEKYTPMIFEEKWGIEYWENGLNFWIPFPNPNAGNYKLFLQNDGNIGIGKKPSYKLDVAGDIATSGSFLTTSDKRLKSNIQPLKNSLNKLLRLNGKSYLKKTLITNSSNIKNYNNLSFIKQKTIENDNFKNQIEDKPEFGFIAQDVIEIFPELVKQDSLGYYSIDYIGLIPVIIEAIKEQKNNLDKQEIEIQNLENLIKNTLISKTQLENTHSSLLINGRDVKYELNKVYSSAYIYIYDQNGNQLDSYPLPHNVLKGSISISKNYKSNQILIYNLVADGNILISKKVLN